MIDKITILVEHGKIWAGINSNSEIVIDKYNVLNNSDLYHGHYKNMSIKQNPLRISIIGSLAKMLNGNNLNNFSKSDYSKAITELENVTKLDFHNANVTGIEYGNTIIVKNPVSDYLKCFGKCSNYGKHIYVKDLLETVTYSTKTGNFEFTVYDKLKEMTDNEKSKFIPELFQNENVIRLELRVKNTAGIKSVFGKKITPYDLMNSDCLKELEARYLEFYKQIAKTDSIVFCNAGNTMTSKDVNEMLAGAFREKHPNEYKDLLGKLKNKGAISDKELQRARNKEKNHASYFVNPNDLIAELNDKILAKQMYCNLRYL